MKKHWVTHDGMRMLVGGSLYRWWTRNRRAVHGNPPIPKPPKPVPPPFHAAIVGYCHTALTFHGKMVYSEQADRSQLFHRKPGDFASAHADCSQFVSSILHWLGVKSITDTDYTGTLLEKGRLVRTPAPGRVAVWGPGTGEHAAFVTEKAGSNDWYVVGFGWSGAPDRSTLSGMNTYFEQQGHPGVRFLDFTP